MTDHLEAARDRLGGLHDHLSRREVALAADDLHAILSAILDHLQQPETAPDPLDETNHADRYDCDGEPWRWCDECDGFRMGTRHKSGYGWNAVEIDERYGPLTFAPRPAGTPTTAPQPEQAQGDADEPARPELNVQTSKAAMARRDDPVDDLVADLNDLAKQRGWQSNTWGNYPGYTEVLIDRDMALDGLEALAAALDATLTLEVRPKEQQ